MPSQLLHYKGLYGDHHQPFSEDTIHLEPIRKRSESYNFEIIEHLHTNLVQIFFVESGGGILLSEGKKITLNPPCIIVIPNGILHGFIFQPDVKGDVFTTSTPFFENALQQTQNIYLKFLQLQQFTYDKVSSNYQEIISIKDKLHQELEKQEVEKKLAIQLLFQLLMLALYRQTITQQSQIISAENRMLTYFHAFQKEISQNINNSKTIRAYAKSLNITPVHLNRICQTLVQKSALQIVHEKIATEAKKYLLHTSNTIAEISYFFDFNDPSHFSKFFKKMEGVSPREFRRNKGD